MGPPDVSSKHTDGAAALGGGSHANRAPSKWTTGPGPRIGGRHLDDAAEVLTTESAHSVYLDTYEADSLLTRRATWHSDEKYVEATDKSRGTRHLVRVQWARSPQGLPYDLGRAAWDHSVRILWR